MPHQDLFSGNKPKKSLTTVFSDFSPSFLVSLPSGKRESIERSTDSLSVALATRDTFRTGLWSSSEPLSDRRSSCERLDGLAAFEKTSAISEDNDFDMC